MSETTANLGNHDALLRELAQRLLAPAGDSWIREPELLVGQIPPDLPFSLPLPPGGIVLGSLLRNAEQKEVVLDVPLSPEEVIDFYKAQMQGIGWHEHPLEEVGGFISTDVPTSRTLFCNGTSDLSMSIIAWKDDSRHTDVRLLLNAGHHSPCAQRASSHQHSWSARNLLPRLDSPGGVKQIEQGGRSDRDSASTTINLEANSDLSVLTLAAHYAVQLEKAGWIRIDEGYSGPLAWNGWTFRDEESTAWHGLFFIIKLLGTVGRCFLYLEIHRSEQR